MPPKLSLPTPRAPYIVDFDESNDPEGAEWEVKETVAKVVIHDVQNLSITFHSGIVTTLEIFNASNLTLNLANDNTSSSSSSLPLSTSRTAYGTLSLDPSLHSVRINYANSDLVGAIVYTTPSGSVPDREVKDVIIKANDRDGRQLVLVDEEGKLARMEGGEQKGQGQYHIGWKEDAWKMRGRWIC